MGYYRKWKPSKKAIKEFKQKMDEIHSFCKENEISYSSTSDSYYFSLNGIDYRVSNHSVESSKYHGDGKEYRKYTFCIHASKTRLIEIYNKIKEGKNINHRGEVI